MENFFNVLIEIQLFYNFVLLYTEKNQLYLSVSSFSLSVMSHSLQTHCLQHTRLLSLSPTPGACQVHVHHVCDEYNHFILCCPLLLLPSVFPNIRVLSNESVLCMRWPNFWSLSISPSNECSELISFRM